MDSNEYTTRQKSLIEAYIRKSESWFDKNRSSDDILAEIEAFEDKQFSLTESSDREGYICFASGQEFLNYLQRYCCNQVWDELMEYVNEMYKKWQKVLLIENREISGNRIHVFKFMAMYSTTIDNPDDVINALRRGRNTGRYRHLVVYVRAYEPIYPQISGKNYRKSKFFIEERIPQTAIMDLLGMRPRKESTGRIPYSKEKVLEVHELRKQGKSIRDIADITKISNPTVQKLLKLKPEEIESRKEMSKAEKEEMKAKKKEEDNNKNQVIEDFPYTESEEFIDYILEE